MELARMILLLSEDENYLFTGDENLGGHIKVWNISRLY